MFSHLIDFLKRSPHAGDRKDPIMPTDSPAPPAPTEPANAPSSSPAADEFHRQLLSLADAVKELSRSQQTLIDAMTRKPQSPPAPPATISGDPGDDGVRPSALVDYTRLSSVQQIALGLRAATPQGPRVLPRRPPTPQPKSPTEADVAPSGAD